MLIALEPLKSMHRRLSVKLLFADIADSECTALDCGSADRKRYASGSWRQLVRSFCGSPEPESPDFLSYELRASH